MNRTELFNLANKGKTKINGIECEVIIRKDRDGEDFIEIFADPLTPLHQRLQLGGKWWEYVTDEECEELPEKLMEYKEKAEVFYRDAQRIVKAEITKDGRIKINEIPESVRTEYENILPGSAKRFERNTHPINFVNRERKYWFALGNFSLQIGEKIYIPHWSYWLDRPYYEADEQIIKEDETK